MKKRRPSELAAVDHLRGMTQVESARKHGVSQGAVSKAAKRIRGRRERARLISRSEMAAREVVAGTMTAADAARKHGISPQSAHVALFAVRGRAHHVEDHQTGPVSSGLGAVSRAMARSLLALGDIADHAT